MNSDELSRGERLSRLFRLHRAIALVRVIKESVLIQALVHQEITDCRLLPGYFMEVDYLERRQLPQTALLNTGCKYPCSYLANFYVHSSDIDNIRQILMKRDQGDWFSVAYRKLEENDECFLEVCVQARDFFVLQEIRDTILEGMGINAYFGAEFRFHDCIPFLLHRWSYQISENWGDKHV